MMFCVCLMLADGMLAMDTQFALSVCYCAQMLKSCSAELVLLAGAKEVPALSQFILAYADKKL